MVDGDNQRILYHLTTDEGFRLIEASGVIKPGPKDVWVERKPVGYVRKGGRIWLCQSSRLNWCIQHLWRQGKYVRVILGIDTSKAQRYHPMPGVWYLTEETPSWFFVSRVVIPPYHTDRGLQLN